MQPYPVPMVHEDMIKNDVEHLFLPVVPELANYSEWGSPYSAQPKPKSG